MREYTGAELAVVNAGALTAGLEAGEITESDLATAMLYGCLLYTSGVDGCLEAALAYMEHVKD